MAKKEKLIVMGIRGTPFFRIARPVPRQKRR
jgi:hypothetical protein